EHAREHNLSKIVMGHRPASFWRPAATLAQRVGRLAPDVDLIELGASAAGRRAVAVERDPVQRGHAFRAEGYLVAAAVCALLTATALPLAAVLDDANIVMLFLL